MWKALLVWLLFHHHTEHTNATFLRKGTKQRRATDQRPWAWHWLPGYQRMLVKVGIVVGPSAGLWLWLVHPVIGMIVLWSINAVILTIGGWWGYRRFRNRKHVRSVVEPVHDALVTILGSDTPWYWQSWLTVPLDYAEETTSGTRLELPAGRSFPAELKAQITEAVSQKLDIGDLQVQWQLAGDKPFVVFKPVPQAPRSVKLADVKEAIATAPDTAPVIGMAKFREIVSLNLKDESPHILISAGSGGGKSVLAKVMIAQFLSRGARVVIMDRKRISHHWAKALPGVEYYRDTEEIHDRLISLAMEGDRRNLLTDDADDPMNVDVGPRIVLVFEEMNATIGKLTNYWASIRTKDEPKRSPALEALGDLVNMGRQVNMHVVAIGQRIETRTLGGGDVRESFGLRCLSRYTVQTWKMLCADVWPMPKKSKIVGRWQIVAASEATETQVVFLTDAEAQQLARSGVAMPSEQADMAVGTDSWDTALVSLRDFYGADYDKRRKQLQRADDAPTPQASGPGGAALYRRVDLMDWTARRDAAVDLDKETV